MSLLSKIVGILVLCVCVGTAAYAGAVATECTRKWRLAA